MSAPANSIAAKSIASEHRPRSLMRILGIHSGHNATACLFQDNRIVAMVSEERFTRKKNQSGFPRFAIQWLANTYDISGKTLDRVAVAGLLASIKEGAWQESAWERLASTVSGFLPARLRCSEALVKPYVAVRKLAEPRLKEMARLLAPYDIRESKIEFVEHHTCHAHAAYWLDFRRTNRETLVMTLDNTGDGLCGTVAVADGANGIRRIKSHQTLRSVGMLYTAITRYLGMKPVEDEYKVMGLAPYARSKQADTVYEILRSHIDLTPDALEFVNKTGFGESAYVRHFQKELAGFRFDNVAAGVQRLVEELVLAYLKAWSRRTGIRRLALGGGVFMNVKLNMLINECDEFEEVFFLPSCGDENNAAGAALKCAWDLHRSTGVKFDPEPLGPLYLGPAYSNEEVEACLKEFEGKVLWRKCREVERETAKLLANNLVVARMSGRMEFGARALGNRSILARADSLNTVRKINAAIKMRDFWMPFAPSILWERQRDYIVNPKGSPAPYMILAFQSTALAREELIAGLHPFDLSCRPQLVEASWNSKFHKLLKHYEEITGFGGVLNTSFNLHGDPVVCSPKDAITTYLQSGLDALTIEDYLIWDPQRLGPSLDESLRDETDSRAAAAQTLR